MQKMQIIFQDEALIAIEKPRCMHVHRPERAEARVPRDQIILQKLRNQIKKRLYPVHRLDYSTSGVLIFALSSKMASQLCGQFTRGEVSKEYWAIVRGHAPGSEVIELPLLSDSSEKMLECKTEIETMQRAELPFAVGKRHASARYSLVRAFPKTGRFHQIRRHLARRSYPVIGDCQHGDSHHNRFFREQLGLQGLWLHARSMQIKHPVTLEPINFKSNWNLEWQQAFSRLQWTTPI